MNDKLRKEIEEAAATVGRHFEHRPLRKAWLPNGARYNVYTCECGREHLSGVMCVRCEIQKETERRRAK